jgi:hypothetical protein
MTRLLPLAVLLALSPGLVAARCGGPEAVPLEELRRDVAPAFDYGLYCDETGRLVGERSAVLLVHRSEHLERVYADARAGNGRAQELVSQLEEAVRRSGEALGDQAQGVVCGTLPSCTVQWKYLEDFIPSQGEGGQRLRALLAESFTGRAKVNGVKNAVIAGALDVLVVGSVLKAGKGGARAAAAETEPAAADMARVERLVGVEGRLALEEAEALAARLSEAEAVEVGTRCPAGLKELERYRPAVSEPPTGVKAESPLWVDYVAYWEGRYQELAGLRSSAAGRAELKPPLRWQSYQQFRERFREALEFQRRVGEAMKGEASGALGARTLLRGLEQPLVTENVGLAHQGGSLTYVDQLVVDEASLGARSRPVVHSFSNKKHDFSSKNVNEALEQLRMDIKEAQSKYGGLVEVRRPGHPLFSRKVIVTRVHLVYDGRGLQSRFREPLADEAYTRGVDLHFHEP